MRKPTIHLLTFSALLVVSFPHVALSQVVHDLNAQWSNATNPNGVWTYREGGNALPAVASWQSSLGGWSIAQPGWAQSSNGNNRIPFWFKSNGSETFVHDWITGDIVVHSRDSLNGVGNGEANVVWTSPVNGLATISGGTWLGRDIGRANRWNLYHGASLISFGDTFDGDAFNRANPFNFAGGSGGLATISNIPVSIGDTLRLEIVSTSGLGGEFQGVNFAVTTVPEPSSLMLLGLPAAIWCRHRTRKQK